MLCVLIRIAPSKKKKKITQERVRNSRGKRTIGVRVIEVLLYIDVPS